MKKVAAPNSEYLFGVNALRGCLALCVLLWHYQHLWLSTEEFDYTSQPWFSALRIPYTRGYDAVPIFWMVSGVVLSRVYLHCLKPSYLVKYFRARFARLYPLHALTLVVVLALQLLGKQSQIYGNSDAKHFVLNLLFIPYWGFDDGYSFNAPIWSVSIELPVYFFFALSIYRTPARLRVVAVLVLTMIFAATSLRDYEALRTIGIRSDFARCAMYFFVGVFITQVIHPLTNRSAKLTAILSFVLVVALAIDVPNILWPTGIALVSLALASDTVLPQLRWKPIVLFGELTYSVFLWHIPIQLLLRRSLIVLELDNQLFGSPILLLVYLAATYIVGFLSFTYFEQPLRRLLNGQVTSRVSQAS